LVTRLYGFLQREISNVDETASRIKIRNISTYIHISSSYTSHVNVPHSGSS